MSAFSLSGRRVVVIGGSSGIGFAVAALAKAQGASVVIASSTQDKLDKAVDRLPGAAGACVDLRDEASVARLFDGLGAFDHLAVTAGDWGSRLFASLSDIDVGEARDAFAVRFFGVLAAAKYASRRIAADGSITLTSGILTHRPRKGSVLAAAVAGGVEHLMYGLAADLAPVRVNAVCPGLILTEYTAAMTPQAVQRFTGHLPLPRAGRAEEAAMAYVYLMVNGYATGQIVPVDGGALSA